MLAVAEERFISETGLTLDSSLADINQYLQDKTPQEILQWAASLNKRTLATTSFGDHSAVLLHMLSQVAPEVMILWIDTGYNTSATYRFADRMIGEYDLNIETYSPLMTSARRNVLLGGIPDPEDELHEEFTHQVKLEPFKRATDELRPEVWISGIRKDQTDFRKSLEIVSITKEGYLKVAPLFNWTEQDLDNYLADYDLPNEPDYFDPTKAHDARECGLHTRF